MKTASKQFLKRVPHEFIQILKNIIRWKAPYYAHNLLGWKKHKTPYPLFLDKVGPYFYHVSCVLNVLQGGTKQGKIMKHLRCCLRFAYARTSFTYARYSTLRRPYADKF